jgi:hypothetical protein
MSVFPQAVVSMASSPQPNCKGLARHRREIDKSIPHHYYLPSLLMHYYGINEL